MKRPSISFVHFITYKYEVLSASGSHKLYKVFLLTRARKSLMTLIRIN